MPNMTELQYEVGLPSVLGFAEDWSVWMKKNDGPPCRLFKFDLRSGHLAIPMHQGMRGDLATAWRGQLYACLVLPFGFGTAVELFQSLMPVLASMLISVRKVAVSMAMFS